MPVNAQIYFRVHIIVNVTEDTLPLCKLSRTKLYKYAAHFCVESFVRGFPCDYGGMELRVFRFFVTCYLTCVLCRNAVDGSTLATVFPSINNVSEPDTKMSEIGNTRTEQSIETETRPDGITLKDDWLMPETPRETPEMQDQSMKTRILNNLKEANCFRYCIQQLENGNGFEEINLVWSFADQNGNDYFLLKNRENQNLKILRHTSVDNKSLTILDYCSIYLNLNCDIVNMERNFIHNELYSSFTHNFNRQNEKILKNDFSSTITEFSKKLVHRTNLSGYTEINFETADANVTRIEINILGNLTHAVLIIPTNKTVQRPGIVMSLVNASNTKGMAIGARNIPGRWCIKLTGVENSNYNFDVIAYYGTNKDDVKNDIITNPINNVKRKDFEILNEKRIIQSKTSTVTRETDENTAGSTNSTNLFLINSTINGKRKFVFERSAIMDSRKNNDEIMTNFSNTSFSSHEPIVDKNIINSFILRNNSWMSYGEFKILPNFLNTKEQNIQTRSSEVASLNEDIDTKVKSTISETVSMQMADSNKNEKLSTQVNEDPYEKKKILLELNANSKLIAAPGTTHRVLFDASNNCILPVRYVFRARSSSFRIVNVQPYFMFLYPGQTDQVAVDIFVPSGSQETINTLSLFIFGTEISEKTVNIYVQNAFSKFNDNVKPTIEYSFNSNCAGKLDKDRCEKTLWSADITVQDYDSGLKRLIAIPNGVYSRTNYISGTKDRVTFYYLATCCITTATITAIDIAENQYTRSIDVTAWNNLETGEIAAIVLGALFLLFLLILLIVGIVYCVRKRKSEDLPYTQRYGSRQPPRAERTSF